MKYAQTNPESCGAAALMVALAEMGIGTPTPDREMELWQRIQATRGTPASMPGLIGLEAARQGVVPRLWVDAERIEQVRHAVGARAAFDVSTLLSEHHRALAAAQAGGIAVEAKPTDPQAMLERLRQGGALMVSVALELPDKRVALHWRLYRFVGEEIWEMDPDGGHDAPITETQLVAMLAGWPYVGAAVSLAPR